MLPPLESTQPEQDGRERHLRPLGQPGGRPGPFGADEDVHRIVLRRQLGPLHRGHDQPLAELVRAEEVEQDRVANRLRTLPQCCGNLAQGCGNPTAPRGCPHRPRGGRTCGRRGRAAQGARGHPGGVRGGGSGLGVDDQLDRAAARPHRPRDQPRLRPDRAQGDQPAGDRLRRRQHLGREPLQRLGHEGEHAHEQGGEEGDQGRLRPVCDRLRGRQHLGVERVERERQPDQSGPQPRDEDDQDRWRAERPRRRLRLALGRGLPARPRSPHRSGEEQDHGQAPAGARRLDHADRRRALDFERDEQRLPAGSADAADHGFGAGRTQSARIDAVRRRALGAEHRLEYRVRRRHGNGSGDRDDPVGPAPIAVVQEAGDLWVTSEGDGDVWRLPPTAGRR